LHHRRPAADQPLTRFQRNATVERGTSSGEGSITIVSPAEEAWSTAASELNGEWMVPSPAAEPVALTYHVRCAALPPGGAAFAASLSMSVTNAAKNSAAFATKVSIGLVLLTPPDCLMILSLVHELAMGCYVREPLKA
jgi:hypothetical protein